MTKSRIGILGGTFDPIHLGHLGLAIEAISKLELRQLFLVPSFLSPHKTDQIITPIDTRIQMVRLAIKPYSDIEVSTLEAERGGISYTVDTVTFFSNKFLKDEIFFLAGMDSFLDMGYWRSFKRIFELSNIAIAVRPGIKMPNIVDCLQSWFGDENPYVRVDSDKFLEKFVRIDKNKQVVFFQPKPCPAASREIRSMVAEGKEVKNLLPAKVENYIIGHHLYKATSPT
jgi:nicotinate-nucleotide adenylyltransferase